LLNATLTHTESSALVGAVFDHFFGDGAAIAILQQLYMTREQIAQLARRGYIGTHGHRHLPLGLLSQQELEGQIAASLMYLKAWTEVDVYALSYPFGGKQASSAAAGETAARLGIAFAFTMERAGNPDLRCPLHLARFATNDLPGGSKSEYALDTLFERVPHREWYLT
jgi:peptidoglycan/xylan/chitin deacetylase (PgdA/CDA1 family)